ncbi:MAG: hypothetical protein LAN62_17180 [Acidobacteriia bacterium]|nr:hypothetical protein [Terriglobia bacterium]
MAEPTNLPRTNPNYCRFLRSKEMYIQAERDPSLPSGRSGHFWCVHTQTVIGPDGKVVTEEECTSSRTCFEAV